MPQIFLEYKPLVEEAEFLAFWSAFVKDQLREATIEEGQIYRVREGLFLGVVSFAHPNRSAVMELFGDSDEDEGNMQSICKSIRLKYTTQKL